jgi:signal recognition particle GTPase
VSFFKSIFGKVREGLGKGLEKTREAFVTGVTGVRSLLLGRRLDEALIKELETRLLSADVGVRTTAKLIDGIREDYRSGKMTSGDQVLEYLKSELKSMWPAQDRGGGGAPPRPPPRRMLWRGRGRGGPPPPPRERRRSF